MDLAIVTGASSGIGLAISTMLLERGYEVWGVARDFSKSNLQHPNFKAKTVDLLSTNQILEFCQKVSSQPSRLNILVNNAGVGLFGPHESIDPKQLADMVSLNLTAPMLLTNKLLRFLRDHQGTVINMASIAALEHPRFGGAYAATKAGLLKFGQSLFEEVRKQGIKVTTILPDMTDTAFYNDLDFSPHASKETVLDPKTIAEAVAFVLDQPAGTVATQMVIRPQRLQVNKKTRTLK